ncbi:SDR family oxidoreductase [Saccharospirillum sp.]|uniref:SDR family oxidoreductase n=1 Tax=Saccharospirillum sp. TaxID=2033801 RepID=UPI0034A091EC
MMNDDSLHREQTQDKQPGLEWAMERKPVFIRSSYKGSEKLRGKVALITGGDSGIGRAIAVHFAREGADVAIAYFGEDTDASETRELVQDEGANCILCSGDVGDVDYCKYLVERVVQEYGSLDILVNNAAEQHPQDEITDISEAQLEKTFRTNVFGYYNMIRAALPRLNDGGRIINTSSVVAHRGSHHLIDYAGTKGAIEALTKSMVQSLAERNITVNCVAPGPIWTPLIPASFDEEKIRKFGSNVPLGRPGEPCEVASCYVFLACDDGSYMTGQTLNPNGGGDF